MPPSTAEHYAPQLAAIERALVAFRHPEAPGEGKKKTNNGTVARCDCGGQFGITRAVLELGPITCEVLGSRFEDTDPETDDTEA